MIRGAYEWFCTGILFLTLCALGSVATVVFWGYVTYVTECCR